jgi:hypothetical protein
VGITHRYFGHDMMPCHVELFKQVIQHDFSDHKHLIKYDYKSNCKDSFFSKILLVHGFQHPMPSISQGTKVLKTKWPLSFPIVNLSIFCHHPFWVHFFLSCPHHYLLFPIDVQLCSEDHILITSMLLSFRLSASCCCPINPCYLRKRNFIVLIIILQNCSKRMWQLFSMSSFIYH